MPKKIKIAKINDSIKKRMKKGTLSISNVCRDVPTTRDTVIKTMRTFYNTLNSTDKVEFILNLRYNLTRNKVIKEVTNTTVDMKKYNEYCEKRKIAKMKKDDVDFIIKNFPLLGKHALVADGFKSEDITIIVRHYKLKRLSKNDILKISAINTISDYSDERVNFILEWYPHWGVYNLIKEGYSAEEIRDIVLAYDLKRLPLNERICYKCKHNRLDNVYKTYNSTCKPCAIARATEYQKIYYPMKNSDGKVEGTNIKTYDTKDKLQKQNVVLNWFKKLFNGA